MIPIINKSIVPLKYRIGFTKYCPSKYDLLYELTEFIEAEHLSDTYSGGFGSTGEK